MTLPVGGKKCDCWGEFLMVYNQVGQNEDVVAPKKHVETNNLEMSFFKKVHLPALVYQSSKLSCFKKPVDRFDSPYNTRTLSSQHGGSVHGRRGRKVLELQILRTWKHLSSLVLGAETADLKPQFQSVSGSVK